MVSVDSTQFWEAENISEVLKNWRAVLRRDKEMATVHNMERQSDGPRISLKAATDILSNSGLGVFRRNSYKSPAWRSSRHPKT